MSASANNIDVKIQFDSSVTLANLMAVPKTMLTQELYAIGTLDRSIITELSQQKGRAFFNMIKFLKEAATNEQGLVVALENQETSYIQELLTYFLDRAETLRFNDYHLMLFFDAFEKEFKDLPILTELQRIMNQNSKYFEVKKILETARLKYSKYAKEIKEIGDFIKLCEVLSCNPWHNPKYDHLRSNAEGITHLLVVAILLEKSEIVDSLVKLPKEIMQLIIETEMAFFLKFDFKKANYYVFQNPHFNIHTIYKHYLKKDNEDRFFTLLSLACQTYSYKTENKIVQSLLNLSKTMDVNFTFNRTSAGLNYHCLFDVILGLKNEEEPALDAEGSLLTGKPGNVEIACQIITDLKNKGFNIPNHTHNNGKDSVFTFLIDLKDKCKINLTTFNMIAEHLIKNFDINFKIRSSHKEKSCLEEIRFVHRFDSVHCSSFRLASHLNAQYYPPIPSYLLRTCRYPYAQRDYFLAALYRSVVNDFEAFVEAIKVTSNPSHDRESLKRRWCGIVREYNRAVSLNELSTTSFDPERIISDYMNHARALNLANELTIKVVVESGCMIEFNKLFYTLNLYDFSRNEEPKSNTEKGIIHEKEAKEFRMSQDLKKRHDYDETLLLQDIHIPMVFSLKQATLSGFCLNHPGFISISDGPQSIITDYLIEDAFLPAFNRGKRRARRTDTARFEEVVTELVKADPIDQLFL